jgi:hypothetical protein
MKSLLATALIVSASFAEQLPETHGRILRAPTKTTTELMDPTADADWTEYQPTVVKKIFDPVMPVPISTEEPVQFHPFTEPDKTQPVIEQPVVEPVVAPT